jgi:hypothetical protein
MSAPSESHVSAALYADNVAVNATAEQLQPIVARGPRGALAVAGLAVTVLLAIWLLFFFVVFVPRGAVG